MKRWCSRDVWCGREELSRGDKKNKYKNEQSSVASWNLHSTGINDSCAYLNTGRPQSPSRTGRRLVCEKERTTKVAKLSQTLHKLLIIVQGELVKGVSAGMVGG